MGRRLRVRARLVQHVDGFVGTGALRDKAVGQHDRRLERVVHDGDGVMRFGLAVQSIPARLAPEAVKRVLDHYIANRADGESFRDYVMRHKVEFFRATTSDLAKPAEIAPELYQDWGDDTEFSLKLGRGECAA